MVTTLERKQKLVVFLAKSADSSEKLQLDKLLDIITPELLFYEFKGESVFNKLIHSGSTFKVFQWLVQNNKDAAILAINKWKTWSESIPLGPELPFKTLLCGAQAYISLLSAELIHLLNDRFLESGRDPRSMGDLFLPMDNKFYYNYSYLCCDIALDKQEAIERLFQIFVNYGLDESTLKRIDGLATLGGVLKDRFPILGETVPQYLKILLPIYDAEPEQTPRMLPIKDVTLLALSFVTNTIGFKGRITDLIEVYEVLTVYENLKDIELTSLFLDNLHFVGDRGLLEQDFYCLPPKGWSESWRVIRERIPEKTLSDITSQLAQNNVFFAKMIAKKHYGIRFPLAWQLVSIPTKRAADWVLFITTSQGKYSPFFCLSLYHEDVPTKASALQCELYRRLIAEVPKNPRWTSDQRSMLIRYQITFQKDWIVGKVIDLYLRGGGYEESETKENVQKLIDAILARYRLTKEEMTAFESSGLRMDELRRYENVFTGEAIDYSRWASPTSAYKYLKNLIKLGENERISLDSLVSERRALALEKRLQNLDFHCSIHQVVQTFDTFSKSPEVALKILILLRSSEGIHPSEEWLLTWDKLSKPFNENTLRKYLWKLFVDDQGKSASLNPGIFWAMRTTLDEPGLFRLARTAADIVRKEPTFTLAALSTLESVGSRQALLGILHMRRRIKNRKILKAINFSIDEIAKEEGLNRNLFLDYSVDSCNLSDNGERVFDFGTHKVTLHMGEEKQVLSRVVDIRGRELRSFPKTAKESNPVLYKEYQTTKKQLIETLHHHARRLEESMSEQRAWALIHFTEAFLKHPIMNYLARHLVWQITSSELDKPLEFRPTRQGIVDVYDQPVKLPESGMVVIIHPLLLSEGSLKIWKNKFLETCFSQPFLQLFRKVYYPLPEESHLYYDNRFESLEVNERTFLRHLKEKGWLIHWSGQWETGFESMISRYFKPFDQTVFLNLTLLDDDEKTTALLNDLKFQKGGKDLSMAEVHPIVFSEAVLEIESIIDEIGEWDLVA